MAVTNVNLSDQMAVFVQKTNIISTNLGDLVTLTTSADSSVVHAVNELDSAQGNIASLTTTDKSTLVAAVNEVKSEVNNFGSGFSGFLRSNQNDVITAGSIRFDDTVPLVIGTDSDFTLTHIGGTTTAAGDITFTGEVSVSNQFTSDSATINGDIDVTGAATIAGNIAVTGTVDGRDIATDGTKLDTLETNADVTDTANVTSAGALMRTGGTMTGNLDANDNVKIRLGASQDLEIYHDTNNSYISDVGSGGLYIKTNALEIQDAAGNGFIQATQGGTLSLYHNGTQVLDTVAGGVQASTFTGSLSGNASTASTLQTARTISLTGDVTGSVSFNGSQNVSISTTTLSMADSSITTNKIVGGAITAPKLHDPVLLLIYNSGGTIVKALHGIGMN